MTGILLTPGEVLIDRYHVDEYLNAGAMQEVYACTDLKLRRRAVVKIPKGGVRDRRFKRGAEMSARINHHNIASTYDYHDDDQRTFLVEELVDGIDLGNRLSNQFHFLDPSLAAHVLHNVIRAVHEAHRSGICHRDLKPSNIMTSHDYAMSSIKLTDFGIAKLAESEIGEEMAEFERDESTLTTSSTLLGAIPYMAPECWRSWTDAGKPMDIWAIGCIAYQLVTGNLPFGSGRRAIAEVVRLEQVGVVSLPPPPLFGRSAATRGLEQELWSMITRCLTVDPQARPNASDLLTACGTWCYATAERRLGSILNYRVSYAGGGQSKTGTIQDDVPPTLYFYHASEFYGPGNPAAGQRVSICVYPGSPKSRAAPILLLRQPV
jgi:serine/threonine protein kinase